MRKMYKTHCKYFVYARGNLTRDNSTNEKENTETCNVDRETRTAFSVIFLDRISVILDYVFIKSHSALISCIVFYIKTYYIIILK